MSVYFWQISTSMLFYCHFNQLIVMNDQFSAASIHVASFFQAPRMPIFLIPQLVLLLILWLPAMAVCVSLSLHIMHSGQQFDFQKPCPTCLYSCFTWSHAQWNLLLCAPQTWIWSILCLKESIAKLGLPTVPKHSKIYRLQGGRWNKKATGKISSVEPGSLLLVAIQNV